MEAQLVPANHSVLQILLLSPTHTTTITSYPPPSLPLPPGAQALLEHDVIETFPVLL